jgi:sensor domain CHASE-containing protein
MTERFVSAAELMSRVLGMRGYPFAVISHPVSSATDDGLRDMAKIAANVARNLLLQP